MALDIQRKREHERRHAHAWIVSLGLALLAGSLACQSPGDERTGPVCPFCNPSVGGETGDFGPSFVCSNLPTRLESLDTVSERVGVSASDLLALANRDQLVSLRWPKRDSGPMLAADTSQLRVSVTARGTANEFSCDLPDSVPERQRPKPRIELPITVSLHSEDDVFAAELEATLSAEAADEARVGRLIVPAEAFAGGLGSSVASYYRSGSSSLALELRFGPNGSAGWIGGPLAHDPQACSFVTYAYWPSDAACWPAHSGVPSDDRDALSPHLERLNQTFSWTWGDGERTRATLTVQLEDGETCDDSGQINHAATARIETADGRLDLTLTARLSGGPSTIYPWPAALSDVEPFSLDLSASVALDGSALSTLLGDSDPSVYAAIVSFYLSSPVALSSPPLKGRLSVVPIDRVGFTDPLPAGELLSGSAHCYSASGARREVLSAELRSEGYDSEEE